MKSLDKSILTISDDVRGTNVFIRKEYCYLNKFDFKVNSSVLFLISAEKDKKKPNKDLLTQLQKILVTEYDTFTDDSDILKYLNKFTVVKDYYGEGTRVYNLKRK